MGYAKEPGFCPDGPASGHEAGQRRAEKVWGLRGDHRGHTQDRVDTIMTLIISTIVTSITPSHHHHHTITPSWQPFKVT